jgi:hypothetical protein
MLRTRTKLSLALIVLLGVGIGVFSSFSDGLYSAVCLFFLPLLVALAFASIIADFGQTNKATKPVTSRVRASSHHRFDLPHTA